MPKLLQIDSCLGIYSTGHITEGIAEIAMNRGWECYIAHGARYIGKTIQNSYKITSKYDEYFHYINSLLFDTHGLHSTLATKKLLKWIDYINPDVINLHCIHGYHINYEILFDYLQLKNIPVVWTFHDCWSFTGHCSHFESVGCDKWKIECNNCALKYDYPKCVGFDNSRRNYKIKKKTFLSIPNLEIVSVSKWLNGLVCQSFFKDMPKRVIYNGIDTDIFKYRESNLRERYGLCNKIVLIAAASTWSQAKGLSDYIELSKRLSDEYKIVLVGLTDKHIQSLPKGILPIPKTNNAIELAELYSMADISLNLSYQETFGLTTVEAMACGTPVIVYNKTASPELITPETGIVVKAGNLEDLIYAIKTISLNGKAKYSKECIERAKKEFDKKARFNDYINLYDSLIGRNHNIKI